MVNSTLRKHVAQLQAREGGLKKRNNGLELELAAKRVACEAAKKEVVNQLQQIKSITIDATL